MRFLREVIAGLIETDVTIASKTKQLDVNAASSVDDLIVSFAGLVRIRLQSVGNVGVCFVDVDMVKEVLVHKFFARAQAYPAGVLPDESAA